MPSGVIQYGCLLISCLVILLVFLRNESGALVHILGGGDLNLSFAIPRALPCTALYMISLTPRVSFYASFIPP